MLTQCFRVWASRAPQEWNWRMKWIPVKLWFVSVSRLKVQQHKRTDKTDTEAELSSSWLEELLNCFLRQMAGGWMLRGDVKQSSSMVRTCSETCLFFIPPRLASPHKWLPHLLTKKNDPNWNSDWFQSRGPQVATPVSWFISRLVLLLSLWPGSALRAYLYFEMRWWDEKSSGSEPDSLGDCLAAVEQLIAAKVTGRCPVLSSSCRLTLERLQVYCLSLSSLFF